MRIAVVGAGGVGGYFGGAMARAGHDVLLLARGEHLAAIRSRGLTVREPEGEFVASVVASEIVEEISPADLVIVAVKSYALADTAPAVARLAAGGALVLPLLNGVEAADGLARGGVARERILPGLALISAARVAPGIVERVSAFRSVVLGEAGGEPSERAERVAAAFREAGAEAKVSTDIALDLWRKLLFIATLSAGCGLARRPLGAVRSAPLGMLLFERAAREAGAVARARGVALPEGEEQSVLDRINKLPAPMKPSFLLDLERGGANELDVLSGAISRFGREAGVATPIHDAAVAALGASRAEA
jgi:2-dehydropantoate 2-reductase